MDSTKNIISSKYFILLSTLTPKELNGLIELTNCHDFNPSTKIHLLIKITCKEHVLTNKEALYKILFPNTEFDDRKLRNLLSRAFKIIQKYIAFKYFETNETNYQGIYIEALKERKIDSFIDSEIDKWQKNLKTTRILNDDFFSQKMEFHDLKYKRELELLTNSKRNFKLSNYEYNKALDENFLLKKMKLFILSYNYQSMINDSEEFTMLEEVIQYVESKKDWSIPIYIYYNLLMIYHKPEEEAYYQNLKKYYDHIEEIFSHSQRREIFLLIQNYTIKKINLGLDKYLKEFFDLFNIMLNNETIYENNILSQWLYKNIITVALRLNEYEWCENFIEIEKENLEKKHQQTTYLLAKSKYLFSVKEYQNALDTSEKIKLDDILSQININIIQIKCLHELDNYDELMLAIEKLDKKLGRKKSLSKLHKSRFKNFSKFIKLINKTNTRKQKSKLFEKIDLEKTVNNKKWLLEKLSK